MAEPGKLFKLVGTAQGSPLTFFKSSWACDEASFPPSTSVLNAPRGTSDS